MMLQQDRKNSGLHFHPSLTWIADTCFSPQSMRPLLCFHVPWYANLWIYTTVSASSSTLSWTFLSKLKMLEWLHSKSFSYLQFLRSPSLLNFYFTSIYYRSIHMFYLHSKLDRSQKLVSVTRITSTVIFTGYVIINYGECHNCVAITNAPATSILTCDRIASQNSQRISRPYNKKMRWLHD